MQIQSQRQIKMQEIQDEILNPSQTLRKLNIEVDNLLNLEGERESDSATIPPEQLIIGSHVIPITEPNKAVEGVIVSFTTYFAIVKPDNTQSKPFRKVKYLLRLIK